MERTSGSEGDQQRLGTDTAVVGHYPHYQTVAEATGARCFRICAEELADLSDDELWRRNLAFLRKNIEADVQFMLATAPVAVRPGSWFEKELAFLFKHGAKLLPLPGLWSTARAR